MTKCKRFSLKRLLPALCACMFLATASPVNVYAADTEIEEWLDEASVVEQEDSGSAAKRNRIIEMLRDEDIMSSLDTDPTVKGGYKVIETILKDPAVDLNGWFSGVKAQWESFFKQEAMSLGVQFESMVKAKANTDGSLSVNKNNVQNDVEDAALKVNILSWNNTTKKNGSTLSNANQGMVSKLLTAVAKEMETFTDNIRAFAVALAITFGAVTMMTMISDRNVSSEAITREFAKLLAGIWFIYNYKFFALLIIRAGTIILDSVQTGVTANNNDIVRYALVKSFYQTLQLGDLDSIAANSTMGLGGTIANVVSDLSGSLFGSITGLIGNGIVQLASSLVIYAVIIELAIRYLLTPIAIADLYSEKWRSNGWMWLKKLFAVSVQGAVIFLMIFVTNTFKNQLGATYSITTNTAINLTMIGMFAKSRQIANDMIGVHGP